MTDISSEIGKRIRVYRKQRSMTQNELAAKIYKSKATISKYEKGEISIDIQTLYDIARVLSLRIEQLIWYDNGTETVVQDQKRIPVFFEGINRLYGYIYDGRNATVLKCIFDILDQMEDGAYKFMMYMNYSDSDQYQICENTYCGYLEHWDTMTTMIMTNQHLPMEKATIQLLASSLDYNTKLGLWTGLSTRPLMPIATKILLSRTPLKEDKSLLEQIQITKEDIRNFRHYNMFPVM